MSKTQLLEFVREQGNLYSVNLSSSSDVELFIILFGQEKNPLFEKLKLNLNTVIKSAALSVKNIDDFKALLEFKHRGTIKDFKIPGQNFIKVLAKNKGFKNMNIFVYDLISYDISLENIYDEIFDNPNLAIIGILIETSTIHDFFKNTSFKLNHYQEHEKNDCKYN